VLSTIFWREIGCQKLGHPVPDSNFVCESNRAVSQQMHRYNPSAWFSRSEPLYGASVPSRRVTRYEMADNCRPHSSSLLMTLGTVFLPLLSPVSENSSIVTVLSLGFDAATVPRPIVASARTAAMLDARKHRRSRDGGTGFRVDDITKASAWIRRAQCGHGSRPDRWPYRNYQQHNPRSPGGRRRDEVGGDRSTFRDARIRSVPMDAPVSAETPQVSWV
jgi:hypothetical protein